MKKSEIEKLPNWMQCAIKELGLKRSTLNIRVEEPCVRQPEQWHNEEYQAASIRRTGQVIIKIDGWRV